MDLPSSSVQVNQTSHLISGAATVPRSPPTDHMPVAATGSQPEGSSESRELSTLLSKAPSSNFGAEDTVVVIMGPAGSGKSSFISKAIGDVGEGVGHHLLAGPHTKEVRATKCMVDEIPMILLDVLGFDSATPDVMLLSKVSRWLDETNKSKAHISAVLLFHSIADNRLRWKPQDLFHRCRAWCGGEVGSQTQTRIDLVTTMWDEVDEEHGNERLAELKDNHWKPMLDSGSTMLCYRNTSESAKELLRAVVCKKSDKIQPAPASRPSEPGGTRDHGDLATPATVGEQPILHPNNAAIQLPQKAIHEADDVRLSELSTQDMLILIIGPAGCGKSSLIGKAIGNEEGIGHTLCAGSHTAEIRATRCTIGNFASAVLLDTPGFDNSRISEKQILDMVSKSLQEVHKDRRIYLSAILLLHPITDNRWTPLKHLRLFQKLCGRDAMAQTGLVTTMWDEVNEDVGNERMTALKSNYWRTMIAQGSKTYRFWNTRDTARELLQEVIRMSEERYHSMLRQEILELKTSKETLATQTLRSRLEQLSERRLEIMRELRSEGGRAVDQGTKETLKREYAQVGADLDVTLNQVQVLKRSPTLPPLRRLLKASNRKYA
ncbi:hypothetical protein EDC04DRAFT_2603051 [Pisolithus marmoratus]|nr:hypothetical protein EDC04DRAFT_2603051 [Pisolithus marmoratus]